MPFKYKGSVTPNSDRVLVSDYVLADSTAFTEGDSVKINTSNVLVLGGAGGATAGILVGFINADGTLVTDNGAGGRYEGTYTTGTSNTVKAIIDISKDSVYSVTLDAARGTTSGSEDNLTNFDTLAASDQLDESTVQAAGSTATFVCLKSDPDPKAPSNSVLVRIQESQVQL